MFSRRLYNVIERLHQHYQNDRDFAIRLLATILAEFGQEISIRGGRVWEASDNGYGCIHQEGVQVEVPAGFIFPYEEIPMDELRQQRFIHLTKGHPYFDVPAQQQLKVSSFTAFPVDADLKYVISLYFQDDEHLAREKNQLEAIIKVLGLFTYQWSEMKEDDRLLGEILHVARQQQLSILPRQMPRFGNFDVYGVSIPFTVVGGDYFQFFEMFGPSLGVVVADVKGKGFSAAVQVTALHRVLKVMADTKLKIAYKCSLINQAFCDDPFTENIIALVYGELGLDGRFNYTNISHVYPLLCRSGGEEMLELDEGGTFFGLRPDAEYHLGIVRLRPGDVLLFYTDGITEIADARGEEYGRTRLKNLLRENRHRTARELVDSVLRESEAFAGHPGRITDDRTIVVIKHM